MRCQRQLQLAERCVVWGEAELCYVPAEALFLAVQVNDDSSRSSSSSSSNVYAFRSLGAEGRYLSASRELSQPLVLEQQRVVPAGQWRVTSAGLVNVQHSHKKLGYSVHEVKAVPLDGAGSLAGLQRCSEAQQARQQAQAGVNEAACKQLERRLQDITSALVADRKEHADTVEQLTQQLSTWKQHGRRLEAELRQQQQAQQQAGQQLQELQAQHQVRGSAAMAAAAAVAAAAAAAAAAARDELELGAAYQEVASLQQQLADQQQQALQESEAMKDALSRELSAHDVDLAEVASLQQQRMDQLAQRHTIEARQWVEVRSRLESSLHAKDDDIAALSGQVQRLDHALKQVQRLMFGSSRRQQLDRASLDAVSIQQLQAAVAQFAQGEVLPAPPSPGCSALRESRALRTLLASSQASDSSAASTHEPDVVPQPALPGHEPPHHSSHPQQQRRSLSAAAHQGCSGGGSDGHDLGPAADQSPGSSMQSAPPALGAAGSLAGACEAHDSPLSKLAASANGAGGSALLRGSQQQQQAGVLGARGMGQRSRPPAPASASVSAGVTWLAAAATAGKEAAGSSSWTGSSGTPGRHMLRTGSSSSGGGARTAAAKPGSSGGPDDLLLPGGGSCWGMADVRASGSSRRAASSAASEEIGTGHRYSCSDLSDVDSGSATGDELEAGDSSSQQQQHQHTSSARQGRGKAAAGGHHDGAEDVTLVSDAGVAADEDDGDLDAIHSLGASLEEDLLRQQLRISSQLQLLQRRQPADAAGAGAASSSPQRSPRAAQALRAVAAAGGGVGGAARRSSGGLLPVQEEEQAGEGHTGGLDMRTAT
ncbi:hypothetical protein COO60DRAFT_1687876 [Scenedesmus sp. NREL 46B-D3]|nr:hypothetical protein COO60DRAFT_1687876 [Scenedesmus sp. NREL 46B-D3]